MKKKVLSILLAGAMVLSLAACGSKSSDSGSAAATSDGTLSGKTIGVAMPTQSSERWINDGKNMKDQLEKLGAKVDLQYAEDDVQAQVSQIENLVAGGVDCLVVVVVDSSALVNVLG